MSKWTTQASYSGMALALTVIASPLAGQDCGQDCHSCGSGSYEGITWSPSGEHNMDCLATDTGWCEECPQAAVSADLVDATLIAKAIEAVAPEEMAAVVAAYGRRLMVHVQRGLVVIRGTKCSEDAIAVVVFTAGNKAQALRRLGIAKLTATAKS